MPSTMGHRAFLRKEQIVPVDNVAIAERIMYELLGRRWVWPAVSAIDSFEFAKQRIHLPGRPVISVESVKINNKEVEGWRLESKAHIRLPQECLGYLWSSSGWSWTGQGRLEDFLAASNCRREVVVEYTYGSPPPEAVDKAIKALACELDKAYSGDDGCRLPARVTSISRQGISMTILDPQDFLENGKTGLIEVDLIISAFNPKQAKSRARVYSADYRPSRRLSSNGS